MSEERDEEIGRAIYGAASELNRGLEAAHRVGLRVDLRVVNLGNFLKDFSAVHVNVLRPIADTREQDDQRLMIGGAL